MIKRTFLLGDEWLYYKIYCGVRIADVLLEGFIADISLKLIKKDLISSWFFIRYGDPDPHLRVRFKIKDCNKIGKVILHFNELAQSYVQDQLIWNLQTATYVRELERYGSSTMAVSEELFFYDSDFIVKTLAVIKDEEQYFLFFLKAIDQFVNHFKLNETEKYVFYKENAAAYKQEFGIGRDTKLSLDKKYRKSIKKLEAVMSDKFIDSVPKKAIVALDNKNFHSKPLINTILKHVKNNTLELTLKNLLSSYVHMSVNRAFRDQQRFYEMLGYDFLVRFQNSKIKKKPI